jgi:hypothetical protein
MSKLFPVTMILTALAMIVVVAFQIMDLRAFGVL